MELSHYYFLVHLGCYSPHARRCERRTVRLKYGIPCCCSPSIVFHRLFMHCLCPSMCWVQFFISRKIAKVSSTSTYILLITFVLSNSLLDIQWSTTHGFSDIMARFYLFECDLKRRLPEQLQPYCALDDNVAPNSGDGEIEVLSETRVLIWPEGAGKQSG